MPRLLTDDKEEIKQIVKEILDIARKDLIYTKKLKHQQMKKEIKKNIITKNANQTSKTAFKKCKP